MSPSQETSKMNRSQANNALHRCMSPRGTGKTQSSSSSTCPRCARSLPRGYWRVCTPIKMTSQASGGSASTRGSSWASRCELVSTSRESMRVQESILKVHHRHACLEVKQTAKLWPGTTRDHHGKSNCLQDSMRKISYRSRVRASR
jgi:hypothetical protein